MALPLIPLAISLPAIPASMWFGCTDGGGSPGVCAVGGEGMGEILYTLIMFHWFSLAAIGPAFILIALGVVLSALAALLKK